MRQSGLGSEPGARAAALPQLLEHPLRARLPSPQGARAPGPSPPPTPCRSPPCWQGPASSPCGSPGSLHGCLPPAGHTSSTGTPTHPFPVVVEEGRQGGTRFPVRSLRCVTSRGKAPSSFCSPPPRSPGRPGSCSVLEDGGPGRVPATSPTRPLRPYPSASTLLLTLQGCCFPHPGPLPLQPGDGFDLGLL